MKKKIIALSILTTLSFTNIYAANAKKNVEVATAEEKLAPSEFVMPPAPALAITLNRMLNNVDWSKYIEVKGIKDLKNDKNRALHLGALGTDAFFLILAKNNTKLEVVAQNINLNLNKLRLNSRSRKSKLNQIDKLIKAKRWKKVQEKIIDLKGAIDTDLKGQTVNTNKQEVITDESKKTLGLLNLTGTWIEGYRLAVSGIRDNFKSEYTNLLIQNELIDHLLGELKNNKSLNGFAKLTDIITILENINTILIKAKNKLTKAQVEELYKVISTSSKLY